MGGQRKAWNEAMRSAAGAAALPPALQPRTTKRRSDRRKKQDRRDKARRVQSVVGDGEDGQELLAAAWMDALEDVTASGAVADDDDSYDEFDDGDADGGAGGGNSTSNKRKRGSSSGGGGGGGSGRGSSSKATAAGILPKRFKARSLATLLLEEVNREDGVARVWLDNEARIPDEQQSILPRRKFCPVTGMEGLYTDPKSGLSYANLKALEQIRERPPPWMTLGGSLAYHEAVKSIREYS